MQRRVPIILLALACLLPFIRLGMGDILPWDESLYVIRAQACLQFGAWLDQTQYAVGHLYSATHPPLGVWLIAISKSLLGNSTFAIRLPSAIAASASIYLMWLLIQKFASASAATIAVVSLASSDLLLALSHRAQMESFILFFGIASIYFSVLAIDRERWKFAMFSGVMFGFGLLTKFGFEFYIAPFMALLPWALHKPRGIRYVIVTFLLGVAIACPWFVMMSLRHADFWQHVGSSLVTLSEGQYEPSKLAWWYYLNRLVVALPLILSAFFLRKSSRWCLASLLWLIVLFAALQIVGTRMPHFAIILLPAGALIIGSVWDGISEIGPKRRLALILIFVLSVGWSASEQLRLFVTHRLPWIEIEIPAIGIITLAITIILAIIFWISNKDASRFAIVFSTLLVGIALAHLASLDESENMDGASNIAVLLPTLPQKSNLVVIHSGFPNEELAPQLAYYSGGWTLGWIPGKTSRAITLDSATTSNYHPDSTHDIAIVARFEDRFYHRPESETRLWDILTSKLRKDFSHERDYRSYFMFY